MASKAAKKKFEKEFVKNFKIESVLNRDGDVLPFALFNPRSEGKVTWACGEDQHGRITSVFKYDNPNSDKKDTNCQYVTQQKAVEMRDILYQNGWLKSKAPGVIMKHPDTGKPLNRADRRKLAKHLVKNEGILDPSNKKTKGSRTSKPRRQ